MAHYIFNRSKVSFPGFAHEYETQKVAREKGPKKRKERVKRKIAYARAPN